MEVTLAANASSQVTKNIYGNERISSVRTLALLVAVVIIILIGVLGNGAVVYIFGWKNREKRSRHERLYLLLGITGLICGVLAPPLLLLRFAPRNKLGLFYRINACKVKVGIVSIDVMVSQCILILICLERYRAIVKPLAPKLKGWVVYSSVAAAAVLGVVIYLPLYLSSSVTCVSPRHLNETQRGLLPFLLVSAVMLSKDMFLSAMMIFLVYRMLHALQRSETFSSKEGVAEKRQKYKKARSILFMMIISFIVCVLPFSAYKFIMACVVVAEKSRAARIRMAAKLESPLPFFMCMLLLANVTSPLIYCFVHPKFVAFRNTLARAIRRLIPVYKSSESGCNSDREPLLQDRNKYPNPRK